jgi:predicted amidophosphoribosyltransferase
MALLDLLCPTRCSACRAPGPLVCDACTLALSAPAVPHVPSPCPAGMPPTWVVAAYGGTVRALLLEFKERGAIGLAGPLGAALARPAAAAAAQHSGPVLIVPVPSAAAAVRRRGDDVVRLLATQAARRLRAEGRPTKVAGVLTQRRRIADSAGLTAQARAANLAGALAVRPSAARLIRGAAVVVVDDLVTTGATFAAAADVLTRGGARVLGSAAVAATQRRSNW